MIEAKIQYKPVIEALQRAAVDMGTRRHQLMRDVSGIMKRAVEDNFAEEGRPKWKDLQSSTKLGLQVSSKNWKALRNGRSVYIKPWSGRILQRSGQLATSIAAYSDANTAVVGTNKVYAAIHQFGGRTKPHVIKARQSRALSFGGIVVRQVNHPGSLIPARPFLKLTPRDLRDIVEKARSFQIGAFTRNGLF